MRFPIIQGLNPLGPYLDSFVVEPEPQKVSLDINQN